MAFKPLDSYSATQNTTEIFTMVEKAWRFFIFVNKFFCVVENTAIFLLR